MTKEEFIEKSKKVHGDKYDYSKVIYINNKTKVTLYCKECCAYFDVRPDNHLNRKSGCPKCAIKHRKQNQPLALSFFIEKAKQVHGDKYDYSKVNYVNNKTKVCIICPIHGEFWQTPSCHLNTKKGCPMCSGNMKKTKNDIKNILCKKYPKYKFVLNDDVTIKSTILFYDENNCEHFVKYNTLLNNDWKPLMITSTSYLIYKLKEKFGDFYDYSLVKFTKRNCKIQLIVKETNEIITNFYYYFLNLKEGRKKYREKLNTESFIEKAKQVHGDKYDYSKVNYVDSRTKVCIICPIHGEFWQGPNNHLSGSGCYKCGRILIKEKQKMGLEQFIEKSKQIHGDKYDYSKVEYVNSQTKVCIICPIHGEFWQTPSCHLRECGCPICKESKLEQKISKLFPTFERQKKFDWLGRQSLDFFIPSKNIAIECQGKQHFGLGGFGSDNFDFELLLSLDIKKYNLCKENGVKLFYLLCDESKNINILDKKYCGIYRNDNIIFNIDETEFNGK